MDNQDEIKRIQQDIDKVLNPESKPEDAAEKGETPKTSEDVFIDDIFKNNAYIYNTPEDYPEETHVLADEKIKPSESTPVTESFYTEVIKKEIKDEGGRNKKTPRHKIAVACIISILGGLFLGGGIGIGIPVANHVIIPRILGIETNIQPAERDPFYFPQNPPRPEFVEAQSFTLFEDNLAVIVSLVEPSVVGVTSISQMTAQNFFFSPNREFTGQASGIIFHEDDENVYIVTNHHVVSGAEVVTITISGSEPVNARSVGSEPNTDLAVIAISKSDLREVGVNSVKVAVFGNSDNVSVGETVLAIGNALGEGNTATRGIISAKNKDITIEGITLNVLQTDAAINLGNSGGPLVNTRGEVIGINTAKISGARVEGTGYSITSNETKAIIEEMMNRKERAFLGVGIENISREQAQMFNIPSMGVLITEVFEGSSAYRAGLQRLDIITAFNDMPVLSVTDLQGYIAGCEVGDDVEITILREGRNVMTIKVTLLPRPAQAGF